MLLRELGLRASRLVGGALTLVYEGGYFVQLPDGQALAVRRLGREAPDLDVVVDAADLKRVTARGVETWRAP